MTIFGYTVRLPDIEPFIGEDRPPQLTAKKVEAIATITRTTSQGLLLTMNRIPVVFFVPSQKLSFPLQFPVDRHSLIFDPRKLKPSSHINCTLCGYVVRLPTKDPLLGVSRTPQFFAVGKEADCSPVSIISKTKRRCTAKECFYDGFFFVWFVW